MSIDLLRCSSRLFGSPLKSRPSDRNRQFRGPGFDALESRHLLACDVPSELVAEVQPSDDGSCGRIFHVHPDGNDANDGRTEEYAFQTWLPFVWTYGGTDHPEIGKIQLQANDKVVFWPGTYSAGYQTSADADHGQTRGFYLRDLKGTADKPIDILAINRSKIATHLIRPAMANAPR